MTVQNPPQMLKRFSSLHNYFLLCGAILSVGSATGCANFGNVMTHPQVTVQAIKVIQTTPGEIRLMASLKCENPNPLILQLQKIEYRFWIDRVVLLSHTQENLPLVRNEQAKTLEIPLVLQTDQVKTLLPDLLTSPKPHVFKFSGRALASNDWAPLPMLFESEGPLVVPVLPSYVFKGFKPSRDKEKSKVELHLELSNPNVFPVQIQKIQGLGELVSFPCTWEVRPPKALELKAQQTLKLSLPLKIQGTTDPQMLSQVDVAKNYWLEGEIDCTSAQGMIMVVIHEKSTAGK